MTKNLIIAAYNAGGIMAAWLIYAIIDYQLKRNICIAFHLNRSNEAEASRSLGQVKGSFGPAEACHYYQ